MSAESQQLDASFPSAAANHSNDRSNRRSSRSDRRSRRHSHRSGHDSLLVPGLSIVLVIILFVAIFSGMKIASLNKTNGVLRTQLDKKQDELTRLRPELAEARRDIESLAKSRFPQLRALEFDKVMPIHDQYVRNIVFTLIKKGKDYRHEYRLLMENKAPTSVLPEARVLLFDKLGVQLGMDQLAKQEPLSSGESRSFSSFVETFVEGEPHYFYVSLKGGKAGINGWSRAKEESRPPAR